jgi:hypothetical protein
MDVLEMFGREEKVGRLRKIKSDSRDKCKAVWERGLKNTKTIIGSSKETNFVFILTYPNVLIVYSFFSCTKIQYTALVNFVAPTGVSL